LATTIRLPTAPVPPRTVHPDELPEVVDSLCVLLVARDVADTIADRVTRYLHPAAQVVVVDDGSVDETGSLAAAAGARVLRLPSSRGEGVALRAGIRFARELGYIGALVPGRDDLSPAGIAALTHAHIRAPEALLVGVGPGEALAGKEWEQAADIAAGREPTPYPTWRPPKADGWPGRVEAAFQTLVETRFGYPWGGPRVLPLQAVLRRDLREAGPAAHIELLALAVHAGIPTVEVELDASPERRVVTCRKAAARLLPRFWLLSTRRTLKERLGMGGGYAPPTTSPLTLALALTAVALSLALTGCPKTASPTVQTVTCPDGMTQRQWPGEGNAAAARDELLARREAVATVWVEQDVRIDDPRLGTRRLKGVMALDGTQRVRVRLLAPMGLTVLDYVQADGRWQLTVPPAGIRRSGADGDSPLEGDEGEQLGMRPDQIVAMLRSVAPDARVRWQDGSCAVLEEVEEGVVVRRLGFGHEGAGADWIVASDEIMQDGQVVARTTYGDYRSVGNGSWPFLSEVSDPIRGTTVVLEATAVRTDGVTDAFFVMTDP
jgi:hypothetical protein